MASAQLIPLPEIERLSPSCIRILGGNPGKFTLQGTNTYLLGKGPQRLLVDTGEGKPPWIAALRQVLAEENTTVKSALLTHWHADHVGGVKDLLAQCPKATIFKNDPTMLGGREVSSEGAGENGTWRDVQERQVFEVDGATLTAVHTPGHTSDHMVFVMRGPEEDEVMLTGDHILGQGTGVFEDLGLYMQSLEKILRLVGSKHVQGYAGHGPVISDLRAKTEEYIKHRLERERQVLETLRSAKEGAPDGQLDAWTPMELVKVIYRDYPENLYEAAAKGVLQILQKLEAEEKVVQGDDGRWRLKGKTGT